ncbi:MAG: Ribonuclease HI [Microgenomates group bacterium GW2011_GWB1_45_17]|nr:MAG: Ribonuclease HI [Microgenomates group bacterium GW2011_GWB1_45_17]
MNYEPTTKTLSVFCDGGARGNPGPAASAFVIKDQSGKILHEQGFYLGVTTNNQAEYQAVIEALKFLSTQHLAPSTQINFYLDSQLVVNQLKGTFKVKDHGLKIKHLEIKRLISNLKFKISNFVYVPRAQNSRADFLVNQTLDSHS